MSPRSGTQDERPRDVAEEVSRLADAVQAWWASAQVPGHLHDPQHDEHQHDEHQHERHRHERKRDERLDEQQRRHHGQQQDEHQHDEHRHTEQVSSCRICPLCRALDLLRAVRPEVLQQVATAAETVAVLLREAAGDPERQAADQPPVPDDADVDAAPGDGTFPGPFPHGTPIAVTDGEPASHDHERGRTAWA